MKAFETVAHCRTTLSCFSSKSETFSHLSLVFNVYSSRDSRTLSTLVKLRVIVSLCVGKTLPCFLPNVAVANCYMLGPYCYYYTTYKTPACGTFLHFDRAVLSSNLSNRG